MAAAIFTMSMEEESAKAHHPHPLSFSETLLEREKAHEKYGPDKIHSSMENSVASIASFQDLSQLGSSEALDSNDVEVGMGSPIRVHEDVEKKSKCVCFQKFFGNYFMPGVFGVYRYRYVEKLNPRHKVARELLSNLSYYSSKIHAFFGNDILPEMKSLATELYFPTDQIDAEGLSAISAEIWAATYLLLNIHKNIREADFYFIRSSYSSLAWDSSQNYRNTVRFFKTLQEFKEKIVPLWMKVEEIVGINVVSVYCDQDSLDYDPPPITCRKSKKATPKEKTLPKVQIREGMTLENRLKLQVIPERTGGHEPKFSETIFEFMEYGEKVEIIKGIMRKPVKALQTGRDVFQRIEPILINEKINIDPKAEMSDVKDEELEETGLTCTKAMKILEVTLKMLYEEVKLSDTMRFDVSETMKALARDIYAFLEYSEWVCNKFSEFSSMLRLCYNFALLCFDLDLPSFDSIVSKEIYSNSRQMEPDEISSVNLNNNAASSLSLLDDEQEFKVLSLTKVMLQASSSYVSPNRTPMVDDDFDWQNFYKTDYHGILQKLPIRYGNYLLKFAADPEVSLMIRQRGGAAPGVSGLVGGGTGFSKIDQS